MSDNQTPIQKFSFPGFKSPNFSTVLKRGEMTPDQRTTLKKKVEQRRFTPIENVKQGYTSLFLSPETKKDTDRFIPSRSNGVSRQLFNLPENILASPSDVSDYNEREQNTLIYGDILEQRLLNINPNKLSGPSKELQSDFFTKFQSSAYSRNRKLSANSQHTPQKIPESNQGSQFTIKRPRVLNFSDKKRKQSRDDRMSAELGPANFLETKVIKDIRNMRRIPKMPYKVLDAPGLTDDFYQDILDWSSRNVISIALGSTLYFWSSNEVDNNVLKISDLEENQSYCALKWTPNGAAIAAGTCSGGLELYDTENLTKFYDATPHAERISSMSWLNNHVLATGSRDKSILVHDIREKKLVSTLVKHEQEVCGLEWSPNGTYMASGGNDNLIYIWDQRMNESPILAFTEHKAAVRALCWSPHQYGLLLSGGGNHDKSLKFWNVTKGQLVQSIVTDSQICNLVFSRHSNEFVTTHGFSGNQIMVWNGQTHERVSVLDGHVSRVLHLALSPCGEKIATAAADETLKFWKVFPKPSSNNPSQGKVMNMLELRQDLRLF